MTIETTKRHEETAEDVAGYLWLNPWAPSYHHHLLTHLGQGGVLFTPKPVPTPGRLPEPAAPLRSFDRLR